MKSNYVSLSGGLGNQLFQFAGALEISKGQKLTLLTKLGKPSSSGELQAELFAFHLPTHVHIDSSGNSSRLIKKVSDLVLQSSSSRKIYLKPIRRILIQVFSTAVFSLYFKELISVPILKGTGYSTVLKSKKSKLLIGFFHSYLYASPREIFTELQLRNPDPLITEHLKRAQEESPLILHLRLGDYKKELGFGIPSIDYYRKAINFHFENSSHSRIWVFTNEVSIAHKFLPEEFTHLYDFITEVAGSAAQTLEVMRFGTGYVIANSTYSWWGAYMSKNPAALVTYPEPWFVSADVPNALIPPSWIGINRG
jgi:hypothetical protein